MSQYEHQSTVADSECAKVGLGRLGDEVRQKLKLFLLMNAPVLMFWKKKLLKRQNWGRLKGRD